MVNRTAPLSRPVEAPRRIRRPIATASDAPATMLDGGAEDAVEVEPIGELVLKGFHRPVAVHDVRALLREPPR